MKVGSKVTVQIARGKFEDGVFARVMKTGKLKVVFSDDTHDFFDPSKVKPAVSARDKRKIANEVLERAARKAGVDRKGRALPSPARAPKDDVKVAARKAAPKTPKVEASSRSLREDSHLMHISPKRLVFALEKMKTHLAYIQEGKFYAIREKSAPKGVAPDAESIERLKKMVIAKADKIDARVYFLNGMNDASLLRALRYAEV